MIHNAGISMRSLVQNTEMEVYRTMMQVNYFSIVQISQFLLPYFMKNQGHFVVINSMADKFGVPYRSGYLASKMVLNVYFGALSAEPEGDKIYVTMVYPGFIHTDSSKHVLKGDGSQNGIMDNG